ncbi:MAG: acyl-CoA thioesterase, partial [Oceanococcus sp.]
MNWDYPNAFVYAVTVKQDDIDRMNHVNNVTYLQYLEDAAWAHTEHLGMGWDIYERLGAGVVAHRTEINYLRAALLGEKLEVATWCTANDGKLRLERSYQIRRPADNATLVRATTQWISVD